MTIFTHDRVVIDVLKREVWNADLSDVTKDAGRVMTSIGFGVATPDISNVEIVTGHDGLSYLKFENEFAAETYCAMLGIKPQLHCVSGYMNGIEAGSAVVRKYEALFDLPAVQAEMHRLGTLLRGYHVVAA